MHVTTITHFFGRDYLHYLTLIIALLASAAFQKRFLTTTLAAPPRAYFLATLKFKLKLKLKAEAQLKH